jgi:hypothetical protein
MGTELKTWMVGSSPGASGRRECTTKQLRNHNFYLNSLFLHSLGVSNSPAHNPRLASRASRSALA